MAISNNSKRGLLTTHERQNLIYGADLSSSEKFVLTALNSFVGSDGKCWPGMSRLSEMTSLEVKTVKRSLTKLEKIGVVKAYTRFDESGRQTSNLYFVDFFSIPQRRGAKSTTPPNLGGGQNQPPPATNFGGGEGANFGGQTNPKESLIGNEKEEDFSISSEAMPGDEDEEIPFDTPTAEPMKTEGEYHPPSPPSAAPIAGDIYEDPIAVQNAQLYKLKKGEMGSGIRLKPNQARYPWNVGNNPLSIDPYFVRALIELNPTWISHDFNQPLTEDAIRHYLQKLTKPDQRLAAEDQLNTVWNESALKREEWRKEQEERTFRVQSLKPETHPILKEIVTLLEKHKVKHVIETRDEFYAMGTPNGFSAEIRRLDGRVLLPMGRLQEYASYVLLAKNLETTPQSLFYSLGDERRLRVAIRCSIQSNYPEIYQLRPREQLEVNAKIEEETDRALAEFLASKTNR